MHFSSCQFPRSLVGLKGLKPAGEKDEERKREEKRRRRRDGRNSERERGRERRREREGREDEERKCEIVRGDIGETRDHRLPLRCCV